MIARQRFYMWTHTPSRSCCERQGHRAASLITVNPTKWQFYSYSQHTINDAVVGGGSFSDCDAPSWYGNMTSKNWKIKAWQKLKCFYPNPNPESWLQNPPTATPYKDRRTIWLVLTTERLQTGNNSNRIENRWSLTDNYASTSIMFSFLYRL